MRLDEFQWSRNPRGMHVYSIFQSPLLIQERYANIRCGWAKLIVVDGGYLGAVRNLFARGITPVVRLYFPRGGARPFDFELRGLMDLYLRAGVKWFEFYNEPNLGIEWPEGITPDWRERETQIAPLMDNWLAWAEYTVSFGTYPGFPPLAESDTLPFAATRWMDAMLTYLRDAHYERFRRVLANGAYCATHPYILNHFYQEVPGGGAASMRSPGSLRASEPGWHFEYPYDPVSQRADPGRTVYGGTALTPNGDPVGLIAMGRMFNERCAEWFGTANVPVLGTEGGIYPFRGTHQQDTRYPPYDEAAQAQATVAMFEWSARQAPPWFFGVALWKEDEYYDQPIPPVIGLLQDTPIVLKTVPALPVMGTGDPRQPAPVIVPGPAPIRGQADHHMIVFAPGVESRWFFETARAYWDRFRPVVTTLTELIEVVPPSQSLAVSVITPPDLVDLMRVTITGRYPNIYLDLLLTTDEAALRAELDRRASIGLRFG